MQLANSRRLIKGIQLLLNDLIWQIAALGEGALLHTMVLSQQCIHCVQKTPLLAEPVLGTGRALPRTTSCSGTLDHLWTAQWEWQMITPGPSPWSHHTTVTILFFLTASQDAFGLFLKTTQRQNWIALINRQTGWKGKQPEFTKSKFHDYTDCGLILVSAAFCRKAGRERSCYSETLL